MSLQSTIEAPAEQTGSAAAPSVARGAGKTRRNLAVLMVAGASATALAFGGAAFMNAYFVANASVEGHSVSTGRVGVTANTVAGTQPIGATGLLPGESASSEIVVTNEGNVPVYLTATLPTADGTDDGLAGALNATIATDGVTGPAGAPLAQWDGKKFGVPTPLAAGESRTFTVTASLPSTVEDAALGAKTAKFNAVFTATQQQGTTAPEPGFN